MLDIEFYLVLLFVQWAAGLCIIIFFDILILDDLIVYPGKERGGKISLPSLKCADEPKQGPRDKNGIIPSRCDKVTWLMLRNNVRGNVTGASKAQLSFQNSEHTKNWEIKWF